MGGRWNTKGRPLVYTSEHPAVAALEVLVHVKRAQLLKDSFVMIEAVIPDESIVTLDPKALTAGWDSIEETKASTGIGDNWFDERISLALRVPSVVMKGQFNVLLNPLHADWPKVRLSEAEGFLFDSRLSQ